MGKERSSWYNVREGKSEHGAKTDAHACMCRTDMRHVNAPASLGNLWFPGLLPERGWCTGITERRAIMRKNVKGIVITIAVIIVVAAGAVFAGVKSGCFLSSKYKVLQALVHTINESEMVSDTDFTGLLATGEKEIEGELKLEGVGKVELDGVLRQDSLQVQVPTFGSLVFVYPYEEEKTGFLVKTLGEERLGMADEVLRFLYDPEEVMTEQEDAWSRLKDTWDTLEFQPYESTEQENGDDDAREAYVTTVSKEQLGDVPVLTEQLEDEVQVVFFLEDGKVAEIQILQDDAACWDITLEATDAKETVTIAKGGDVQYELIYQKESGILKLQTGNYKQDQKKNRLRLQIDGDEVIIDIRKVQFSDAVLSGTFSVKKADETKELDGTEVNLGAMEENDWEAIVTEIKAELLKRALSFF